MTVFVKTSLQIAIGQGPIQTLSQPLKGCLVADFRYYGALQHQQNMLQDYVRTATYHHAITENEADFRDKLVMDVGAGTGILSLFAAQVTCPAVHVGCCLALLSTAQCRLAHPQHLALFS